MSSVAICGILFALQTMHKKTGTNTCVVDIEARLVTYAQAVLAPPPPKKTNNVCVQMILELFKFRF